MIPIRFGFRFAGLIALATGELVGTRVFHIWFIPIFPLGTYRMVSDSEGVPTKFSFLSLLAAYFNSWGWLAAIGLTALALDAGRRDPFWLFIAAAAVLFGLVYASWLFLGRTELNRPSTGGYVLVGVLALASFGALGYGVVNHRASAISDSFIGRPPEADSPMSAVTMAMGKVKATSASDLSELDEGQMVEFAVEGGYAHGVVAHKTDAYSDWVQVKAGRKMESLSVHRDALTVLEPQ